MKYPKVPEIKKHTKPKPNDVILTPRTHSHWPSQTQVATETKNCNHNHT